MKKLSLLVSALLFSSASAMASNIELNGQTPVGVPFDWKSEQFADNILLYNHSKQDLKISIHVISLFTQGGINLYTYSGAQCGDDNNKNHHVVEGQTITCVMKGNTRGYDSALVFNSDKDGRQTAGYYIVEK